LAEDLLYWGPLIEAFDEGNSRILAIKKNNSQISYQPGQVNFPISRVRFARLIGKFT